MSVRGTLDKPLCVAADAADAHKRLLDLCHLLRQLWHHHVSQAKPMSISVSREYNQELADRLAYHLGDRRDLPELKFDASGKKNALGKLSDAMSLQESVTTNHVREKLSSWLMHHPTCKKLDARRGNLNWAKTKGTCTCGLDQAMGVDNG